MRRRDHVELRKQKKGELKMNEYSAPEVVLIGEAFDIIAGAKACASACDNSGDGYIVQCGYDIDE
jgi:hypothetical protein